MSADLFWFDDEQWSKVEPHLPTNQRGPERHDDRRILSGIMHVQKVGCRWKDCPSEYGPHKTALGFGFRLACPRHGLHLRSA